VQPALRVLPELGHQPEACRWAGHCRCMRNLIG
jgi:hypothetical protein